MPKSPILSQEQCSSPDSLSTLCCPTDEHHVRTAALGLTAQENTVPKLSVDLLYDSRIVKEACWQDNPAVARPRIRVDEVDAGCSAVLLFLLTPISAESKLYLEHFSVKVKGGEVRDVVFLVVRQPKPVPIILPSVLFSIASNDRDGYCCVILPTPKVPV